MSYHLENDWICIVSLWNPECSRSWHILECGVTLDVRAAIPNSNSSLAEPTAHLPQLSNPISTHLNHLLAMVEKRLEMGCWSCCRSLVFENNLLVLRHERSRVSIEVTAMQAHKKGDGYRR